MRPLCVLLSALALAEARDFTPPSLKPGRQAFASTLTRSRLLDKIRVGLSISATDNVVLDLEPNTELLSPSYEEFEIQADGSKRTVRTGGQIPLCWYKGKIAGDPNSHVIASDCEGFAGVIQRGDGRNHIVKARGLNDDVFVHALDDEADSPGACGVREHPTPTPAHSLDSHPEESHSIPPPGRRLLETNTSLNVIEIALVSDNGYMRARGGPYGRNLTAIGQLNIELVNIVQATYIATGFARPTSVRLKAQYFFTGGDPYSTFVENGEVDEGDLLNAFTAFTTTLPSYDHVHLLTYFDLSGDTVGFAHTSSACQTDNTALSMASNTPLRVANTMSHELGHVLGMLHDSSGNACADSGNVMAATNSCPPSGLCTFSSCSISYKDIYTASVSCLYDWTESTCADGKWNGNETGVDCGGPVCAPCTTQTGCLINNGGCAQSCIPQGPTAYTCGCNSTTYLDPANGSACIADINQCLSPSPCTESCTNILAPGGVYKSFICGCTTVGTVLSAEDGLNCVTPSCFDRVKNQDEILTDCGGVCTRSCKCLISSGTFQYNYDRGFRVANAQWRSSPDTPNIYELRKYNVPVRYLYASAANQWVYDDDTNSAGYKGTIYTGGSTPPSGTWQIYSGVGSTFNQDSFTFATCASVASTCGNGIVEGGEMCDSCLVYSGGSCIKPNPCCDSTCLAPRPRGLSCTDSTDLPGACWDGECITRHSSCDLVTTTNCFNYPNCISATGGGGTCGAVEGPFTTTSCDSGIDCYVGCLRTSLTGAAAIRGFPCSTVDANGMYPSVCSGGPIGDGVGSTCMTVASLSEFLTAAPTQAPTPPTAAPTTAPSPPTLSPVTKSPTPPTTSAPTSNPTTPWPTLSPTTASPTPPTVRALNGVGKLAVSGIGLVLFLLM